ncbi:MAG: sigma-70 family RNA polymerase sigma factor [Planctomycetota bacterium]|nr:MAG: sigma-70 family RNA polymerase sigma factor [Planctomycetota bacterium]
MAPPWRWYCAPRDPGGRARPRRGVFLTPSGGIRAGSRLSTGAGPSPSSRAPSRPNDAMFRATLDPVSDRIPFSVLLEGARRADPESLDALARRFYPAVQRLVHHRLATDMRQHRPWICARFSTGDVVQSVFEGVLRDLGAFAGETEEAFVGYLAIVVRNRILDAVRFHEAAQRDGRRASSITQRLDVASAEPDPVDAAISEERLAQLVAALGEFEPRVQHLLRARSEGLASFRELAAQLGYGSESAARRACFAAQAKLALRLAGDG